jgi:hypothetical protein
VEPARMEASSTLIMDNQKSFKFLPIYVCVFCIKSLQKHCAIIALSLDWRFQNLRIFEACLLNLFLMAPQTTWNFVHSFTWRTTALS